MRKRKMGKDNSSRIMRKKNAITNYVRMIIQFHAINSHKNFLQSKKRNVCTDYRYLRITCEDDSKNPVSSTFWDLGKLHLPLNTKDFQCDILLSEICFCKPVIPNKQLISFINQSLTQVCKRHHAKKLQNLHFCWWFDTFFICGSIFWEWPSQFFLMTYSMLESFPIFFTIIFSSSLQITSFYLILQILL